MRFTLFALLLLLLPASLAPPARAQAINQNVRVIVPFAPGGTVDQLGRIIADGLTPYLGGRTAVVENRSGAGTLIAMQAVANAPADGHTIALAATTVLATAAILPGPAPLIDLDRALLPVTNLIRVPIVLVGQARAPYGNLRELIQFGRANPGRLNIGQAGVGGLTHLLAERLALEAGLAMEQIQYRGGVPALLDILNGTCDLYFSLLPESLPYIRDGSLRALATAASAPLDVLPEVGTMREVLPGFSSDVSYGIVVAAGTPPEWVAFWGQALREIAARPAVAERMRQLLWEPALGSPEAYRAEILDQRRSWAPVIRAANIRVGG